MSGSRKAIFVALPIVISLVVCLYFGHEWLPEGQLKYTSLQFRDRVDGLRLTYENWSAEINQHDDLLEGLLNRLRRLKDRPWLFKYQSDVEESYFLTLLQRAHPPAELFARSIGGSTLLQAVADASSSAKHRPYTQLFKYVLERTERPCPPGETLHSIVHRLVAQNNLPLTETVLTLDACRTLLSIKDGNDKTPLDYVAHAAMAQLLVAHHARVDQQLIATWMSRAFMNDSITWSALIDAGMMVEVLLGPVDSALALESLNDVMRELGPRQAIVPPLDTAKNTLLARVAAGLGTSIVSIEHVVLDRESALLPKKEIQLHMKPRERSVMVVSVTGAAALHSAQSFRSALIVAVDSAADSFDLRVSEQVHVAHMLAGEAVHRQRDTLLGAYPYMVLTADSHVFARLTVAALVTCGNVVAPCHGQFRVEFVPFAEHLANKTERAWHEFTAHPFSLFRMAALLWLPFMELIPKTSSSIIQLARVVPIFVSLFGFVSAGSMWAVYWLYYLLGGVALLTPLVLIRKLLNI